MNKKIILTIAIGLLAPLSGCLDLDSGPDDWDTAERWDEERVYGDYDPTLEADLTLQRTHLQGDLGNIRGFSVEPEASEGFRDGYGEYGVVVEETLESGALVMALLHFEAGVLEQEPGVTHSYTPFSPSGDEPYMDVVGCSGAAEMLDFDLPADQVDVTLVPSSTNPDTTTLEFVATFTSEHGVQRAEGSVDIVIPGGQSGSTAPGR